MLYTIKIEPVEYIRKVKPAYVETLEQGKLLNDYMWNVVKFTNTINNYYRRFCIKSAINNRLGKGPKYRCSYREFRKRFDWYEAIALKIIIFWECEIFCYSQIRRDVCK